MGGSACECRCPQRTEISIPCSWSYWGVTDAGSGSSTRTAFWFAF